MSAPPQSFVCALIEPRTVSGLITASVLRRDGFRVTVFAKEHSPGGNWSSERIYPGLRTNGIYHEFRFSDQDYLPAELDGRALPNERIAGIAVSDYLDRFATARLDGCIRYTTTLVHLERDTDDRGWILTLDDNKSNTTTRESFDKVVLATGENHRAYIPDALASSMHRFKGPVLHSSELASSHPRILEAVGSREDNKGGVVVVVGGGKSAQDAASWFCQQGRQVVQCMSQTLYPAPISNRRKLPDWIRRSRLMTLFSPMRRSDSRLHRFLHETRLGACVVRWLVQKAQAKVYKDFELDGKSYAPRQALFWGARSAGPGDPHDPSTYWYSVLRTGAIRIVAARVLEFDQDGESIRLDDGSLLKARAVVMATGFQDSISPFLDANTRQSVGLASEPPAERLPAPDYPILRDGPPIIADEPRVLQLLRGTVPVRNFDRRDLAVIGYMRNLSYCYLGEVTAHWISCYFSNDPTFGIKTAQDAAHEASLDTAWLLRRFPTRSCLAPTKSDEAPCSNGDALSGVWGFADTMLQDLGLRPRRGRGLFWFLKVIDPAELAALHEERVARRNVLEKDL